MYPEAGYSLDGTTTRIPKRIGVLVKKLKVPVVMITATHVKGPCVLQPGGPSPLSPVPALKPLVPPTAEAGRLGAALGPQLWTLLLHKFTDWL